ncbi:hypothetical protein AJ66_06213 [Pseudomonas aeruginosa 3579]|nr:hypothetical protein AJ66_06213 [Pseudomonas aeruginosa 3579]EZO00358.1 hypothetical protein AJ65_06206 [Pseudomonas aeruginosa 3578]
MLLFPRDVPRRQTDDDQEAQRSTFKRPALPDRHNVIGSQFLACGRGTRMRLPESVELFLILPDAGIHDLAAQTVLDLADIAIIGAESCGFLTAIHDLDKVTNCTVDLAVTLSDQQHIGQFVTMKRIPLLNRHRRAAQRYRKVTFIDHIQRPEAFIRMPPRVRVMINPAKRAYYPTLLLATLIFEQLNSRIPKLDQVPRLRKKRLELIHIQSQVRDDLSPLIQRRNNMIDNSLMRLSATRLAQDQVNHYDPQRTNGIVCNRNRTTRAPTISVIA